MSKAKKRLSNVMVGEAAFPLLEALRECASLIEYVLDDGYSYEGGAEVLKKARAAIKRAERKEK